MPATEVNCAACGLRQQPGQRCVRCGVALLAFQQAPTLTDATRPAGDSFSNSAATVVGPSAPTRAEGTPFRPTPRSGVHPPATLSSKVGDNLLQAEVEAARQDPRRAFGPFLLLGELGRGGMGIVHKAWDERLKRVVALKMLLGEGEEGRVALERFRREAEVVARLRHPGIVSIHEIGSVDGRPFIAMEFIAGRTLDKRIGGTARLPLARAIEALRDVARAVHHAHEQGVVHRDLKPQNIIVDDRDRPYVLDFGLARVRDSGTKVTKTGAAMGTPAYMPPEQAGDAGEVDERSDVYSLGATLYHVLAGRPPFSGDSHYHVIAALLTKDPDPPSTWNPRARGDLDTIALKCLEKDPERRYPSADALADDLERWLAGDPIAARPLGSVARLIRSARRHRLVTAVGFLATLGVGGFALIAIDKALAAAREQEARQAAERKNLEEREERARLQTDEILLERARRAIAEGHPRHAMVYAAHALARRDTLSRRATYLHARMLPWQAPKVLVQHGGPAHALAALASSRLVATGARDGSIKVWDVATGELRIRLDVSKRGVVHHLDFSPDETRLAAAVESGTLEVWDLASGRSLALQEHPGIHAVAWSADGALLALGREDGRVIVLDARTFEAVRDIRQPEGKGVLALAWNPRASRELAFGGRGTIVFLADIETAKVNSYLRHTNSIYTLAWDPSGQRLASGGLDYAVAVWSRFAPGRLRERDWNQGPWDAVSALAWSPDGRSLAVASEDESVRLWDTTTGLVAELDDASTVRHARWLASPRSLVMLDPTTGDLRQWSFDRATPIVSVEAHAHGTPVNRIAFSNDGRVASVGRDGRVVVHEPGLERGREVGRHPIWLAGLAWLPEGRLVTASLGLRSSSLKLWDVDRSAELAATKPDDRWNHDVAVSPDGTRLAVSSGGQVRFHDARTLEVTGALGEPDGTGAVAWSRDGSRLATGNASGWRLWDATTLAPIGELHPHERGAASVAFSPDGRFVATAGADRVLRLWHVETGKLRRELRGHGNTITRLAFAPDSKRIATGSTDRTVKIWDAASEAEPASLALWGSAVISLEFAPDGRTLAVGTRQGELALCSLDLIIGKIDARAIVAEAEAGAQLALDDGLDVVPRRK